ncbi:hypothetical protein [Microvirga sp. VF16]|uniref:hypothetical protein n=1 Tax=Microvirga sp. VF16 TaxID=2807101 RepID=UPI00193D9F63|nr:hypothetical protein [Microvirga sp. VF16]QRM34990.1 hypothetical protein JO965_42785 [Microvirga sp. VF16]
MSAPLRWIALLAVLIVGNVGFISEAWAGKSQLGPKTNYSASDIANAVRNSNLNPSLRQYADQMGNLGMFESGGNAGIYNGSCCTGVFQLNRSNLAAAGYTPEEYANAGLDEQVRVWANLTNQGANTAVVRQLQQMGTFDGQQVDGAMIMACIQLGTGNCQKMVQSGKCSGFSDINGTTICAMAQKMRNGASTPTEVSDPFQNIAEGTDTSDLSSRPDLQVQECWGCDGVARVVEITGRIGPALINKFGTKAAKLMGVIFSIVFALLIAGRLFWISRSGGWNDIFWLVMRFTFVITLIGTGSVYTEIVRPYVLVPSMSLGGELGTKLANVGNNAFKNNKSTGVCRYDRISGTDQEIIRAGESVIKLVCAVHLTVNEAIKKGSEPASRIETADSSARSTIVSFALSIFFFIVFGLYWLALLLFAFQIVEALVRMGFFVAFAPFLAYAWVYKSTQKTFTNALRSFFYGSVLLVMSGLLSAVVLFVLAQGIEKAGNPNAISIGSAQGLGNVIYFLIYSFATAAMAASIMRAAPSLAASISSYQGMAGENSFAAGAVSSIMHGARVAASLGGTVALGAGGLAGRGAGFAGPKVWDFLKGAAKNSLGGAKGIPNIPGAASTTQTVKAFSAGP